MVLFGNRNSINQKIKIKNVYFRMACLLQLECNFLHGYFRCQLPGPWSTRIHPHPTIIKKMRTFLEVEGKMGPILQPASSQYRPPQPDTNPNVRRDKATEKRKRTVPTKRLRPNTASRPGETAMCPPTIISKAPVNAKPQADVSENRPQPLEDAQVHESTPWPGAGKMSGSLFEDRNWLLPPNYLNNDSKNATGITSPKPPNKRREMWMGTRLSLLQKSGLRRNLDCSHQNKIQQKSPVQPETQRPQARHPQTLNYQKPQNSQKLNQETQIDKYPSQTKICKQWEAEMERLNTKYNLDCFSDS